MEGGELRDEQQRLSTRMCMHQGAHLQHILIDCAMPMDNLPARGKTWLPPQQARRLI